MKKLIFLISVLFLGLAHQVSATVYYIDCVNGNNANTGLGTTTALAWADIDQFTDNTRSAGDIAFVRRDGTGCEDGTDVTITSDGTANNPITLSADYDNLWSDFSTSSVTWTPVFGDTFIASSASSTDFSTSNKWVYLQGDCGETYNSTTLNTCDFAYEVASTGPSGIDLYLPYKGNQSGSGNSMRVMPANPVWNTASGDFQWTFSTDHNWVFKGFDVRGTDTGCSVSISFQDTVLSDMIMQGDGVSDCGFRANGWGVTNAKKIRTFKSLTGVYPASASGIHALYISDALIDCDNTASSRGIATQHLIFIEDAVIRNCVNSYHMDPGASSGIFNARNLLGPKTSATISGRAQISFFYFDDAFGNVGTSYTFSTRVTNVETAGTTTSSTLDNLRTGGGPSNQLIMPPSGTSDTGISSKVFPLSYIKLFEYPIYTDTSSKTYSMYFNSTSTAQWTSDPTASEFWIECEAYGHATNAHRKIVKSTNVVDFNGSTDWQALSVTCQPTQAGVLYLRGYYGKPKEAGGNIFYMDTTPVIQ